MAKAKSSNTARILLLSAALLLSASYVRLCWLVSADRLLTESQITRLSFLTVDSVNTGAFIHSSDFYVRTAVYLQYRNHDPAEVDRLYRKAVPASPSDSAPMLSYLSYLKARDCCKVQIGLLLEGSAQRDPGSMDLCLAVIAFFQEEGKIDKALQYFRRAMKLDAATRKSRLLEQMQKEGMDPSALIALIPQTKENLHPLLRLFSSGGSRYQSQWKAVLNQISISELKPLQTLEIANQAVRVREYGVAREYALLAMESAETREEASEILVGLDRRQ